MVKTYLIEHFTMLASALAVVVLTLAVSAGNANAGRNYFEYPNYVARTCNGDLIEPTVKSYVFGFMDNTGGCATRVVFANSFREAVSCAEQSCPNCSVEEITGTAKYSSAVENLDPLATYCPAK